MRITKDITAMAFPRRDWPLILGFVTVFAAALFIILVVVVMMLSGGNKRPINVHLNNLPNEFQANDE